MIQHIASVRSYVAVFVALLVLLFATVGAAYLPLGILHFPIAMVIAGAKAVLIVLIFMHALHSNRFIYVVCVAAMLWLAIMLALTLTDYHSRSEDRSRAEYQARGWLEIPGK
jgi:cytochrome c oxidase subunit 4